MPCSDAVVKLAARGFLAFSRTEGESCEAWPHPMQPRGSNERSRIWTPSVGTQRRVKAAIVSLNVSHGSLAGSYEPKVKALANASTGSDGSSMIILVLVVNSFHTHTWQSNHMFTKVFDLRQHMNQRI